MANTQFTFKTFPDTKYQSRSCSFALVFLFAVIPFLIISCASPQDPETRPLLRLHAHNDYEHKRPLFDALEHGFCSIEADIYLVNGQLLVAHERRQVSPERTLEKLYLDPLRERFIKNRGRIYRGGPEVTLLIDIKTDWRTTYPVLRQTLQRYEKMLSTFKGDLKKQSAVLAIITGDRSKEMFAGEKLRLAALDGELEDLNSDLPASLIPWISSNWSKSFSWRGAGAFSEDEKMKLKQIVERAHQQGRRVRFWGSPDKAPFWRELLDNGVDLINTDDLEGAQEFLLKSGSS
jgi:hypothetical protein